MKTLVISISILLSIASCRNSTPNNNKIENVVSYAKFGSDTLFNFENEVEGKVPKGFSSTATGKAKSIKWSIVNDNGNKVVAQQAINKGSCYNLLILDKDGYKDFTATVKIKAILGEEDQGGGLVWRYIDKDNYYIARYNPLENNFRFYSVVDGNRKKLLSVDSDIKQGEWFTMTIETKGNRITCSLNGKALIESTDDTFQSAGLIGFWTKADAVTYFDDLKINKDK
ncbi:MAG: family 16 glycoside hydrolase [Bacteroidota bacterium]|nr:family 16 glycoside hydrolase [Bacteroidota bacterium]